MSLAQRIEDEYKAAFRGGQKTVTEALRMIKAAFQSAEIEKRGKAGDHRQGGASREAKLTNEEGLAIIKRQVKQLEEAGELFVKGGRADLKDKNDAELAILKKYLPAQVDEGKVREVAKAVIARLGTVSTSDFGKVMGATVKELKGASDGALVSKVVKELLAG